MPAHEHDLAQLSAALCASTGDSGDDGDKLQDYYITKAYQKLGMDTVLYNFPDSTKGFRHEYTHLVSYRKSGQGEGLSEEDRKKVEGSLVDKSWDEHCFAIGNKDVKIDGQNTHVIVITLRGTQSSDETIGDGTAWPGATFYGYRVYDYWNDYANKVLEMLKYYVDEHKKLKTGNVKILIGGHSLGGGAANLVGAALDYDRESYYDPSWKLVKQIAWEGPKAKADILVFTFGGLNVFGKDIADIADESRRDHPSGEMFDNIHNLFTYYDTFGPNGDGVPVAGGKTTNLRKFGDTFTMRKGLDYKEIFTRKKTYANHNMPAYTKAIYDGEDYLYLSGLSEPMSGDNITSISTSSIPSVKALNNFMMYFAGYRNENNNGEWEREYDCKNTDKGKISLMSNLFGTYSGAGPCVDYNIYPGEKPEMFDNQAVDPKEWVEDPRVAPELHSYYNGEGIYAKFNQKQVNWILMNIFNVPYQDERAMAKKGEEDLEFYAYESSYFDRNYYKPYGSTVADTAGVTPKYHKALTDNEGRYCFKYSYEGFDGPYYAVMELKEIDDKKYWSIYSNSKNPPENLRKYFEGDEDAMNECSQYVEGHLSKAEIEKIFEEAFFYQGDSMTNAELSQEGWRRVGFIMALIAGKERTIPYEDYPEPAMDFFYPEALSIADANRYVSFFSDYRYEPGMPLEEYEDGIQEITDDRNVYFDIGPWRSSASYDAKAKMTGMKIDGDKAYIYVNLKRYTITDSFYGDSWEEKQTADLDLVGVMEKTNSGLYRLDHIVPE